MSTPQEPTPNPRSISQTRTHQRSGSSPPPRPTTPLRPPSRTSLRASTTQHSPSTTVSSDTTPLTSLEPAFAELSDGMADLEANFVHLQLMHESLSRFNECFASFLYGCNVNAFCVDFPEAPVGESFRRARENPAFLAAAREMASRDGGFGGGFGRGCGFDGYTAGGGREDREESGDQTFLTTDTSFVENPPASSQKSGGRGGSQFETPGRRQPVTPRAKPQAGAGRGTSSRGGNSAGVERGRGGVGRGRASGLARASGRGRGGVGR